MSLKAKLYTLCLLLHGVLFSFAMFFYAELGIWILAIELLLVSTLVTFLKLIKKALEPLEYIDTFSTLLKEQEFTARFSHLKQNELDQIIDQFNLMLQRLHRERLAIGEQKGVFEKLMAESPIGVVLLDFDGKISEINPAAELLLKLEKSFVLGKNFKQLSVTSIHYLQDVKTNEHQLVIADKGRRLKIGHYDIHDRGFDRSFYMVYEMTGDILQSQKTAYEKLIRLMSHEVNNTIAITNSLLESCLTFKEELSGESKSDYEEAIQIVMSRCGSLNQFMQGYSDIVKLGKPIKSEFNITKLLNDLTRLFHSECQSREINLTFTMTKPVIIHADANLIEQALINVLKNAIEAIEQQGEILITLTVDEKEIHLIISDTGCGISEENQRQLFTPFFTSKVTGQGVGLMLIREIFNLHNYSFSLDNNPNEIGASFVIEIPR